MFRVVLTAANRAFSILPKRTPGYKLTIQEVRWLR